MGGSVDRQPPQPDPAQALLTLAAPERLPILAVDDRDENLVALEAVLAPLELAVVTARSGEEALRLILERDFALILLDVRMPGMDGIETAKMIKARERTREVPIVFLTAAPDEVSDMVRGYDVGAVDYLLKPFDEELLRSKVAVFAELQHRRVALQHSEAFLRSAFEAAPIGKTLLNTEWHVVLANPAFASLVGRTQEDIAGIEITELCHPEDRDALKSMLQRAGAERVTGSAAEAELGLDVRLITADRHELWVAPTASSVEGSELTTPLVLVQWVDVSGRRRAEQARGELLLEHAARAQAEAQAERLQKLQQLGETLESQSLDELIAELARRLLDVFDADAAEVRVDDGGDGRPIVSTSGGHARRPDPELAVADTRGWQEEALTADGAVIGVVRIAEPTGQSFTPAERSLLRDAAEHASLLVRRVQLHEHEHRIAIELQRGLLPTRLPNLPGVAIAAHCQAAGLTAEVGGDWYDAFLLPGDRLGVVIGDVTGSGIRAASAMGQLRSVTRAFALADPAPSSPAEVLKRLHRYHQQVGIKELFTVLYLIVDRTEGTVVWANAGHPPPILRARSGEVRTLSGAQSLMSLKNVVYEDQVAAVAEGDTVILYTDGLVERRGESIDAGVARLASAVESGPDEPQALCSYLLQSAQADGAHRDDDLTALVMGLVGEGAEQPMIGDPGAAEKRVQFTLARDVNAPGMARKLIERAFGGSLDAEELARAKLAVSELATNAVLHGTGEITLLADIDDSRLLVEVVDEGSGFEHSIRARAFEEVGGRGLNIVDAESSRWGTHEGTTHVWFEIERRGPRLGAEQRPPVRPLRP
ncbi:MAG TPA: SpoIIE family protein phosphatase [Solirubrobacteraceae bacterium]